MQGGDAYVKELLYKIDENGGKDGEISSWNLLGGVILEAMTVSEVASDIIRQIAESNDEYVSLSLNSHILILLVFVKI